MNIFKEMLSDSGKGTLSSKRVMGALTFVVCLSCIVYLTITAGATTIVENLLQTAMLMAAALLGLSSVTNIWSDKVKNPTLPPTPPNDNKCHCDDYIDDNNCHCNDYIDDNNCHCNDYIDNVIDKEPKTKRKKSKK